MLPLLLINARSDWKSVKKWRLEINSSPSCFRSDQAEAKPSPNPISQRPFKKTSTFPSSKALGIVFMVSFSSTLLSHIFASTLNILWTSSCSSFYVFLLFFRLRSQKRRVLYSLRTPTHTQKKSRKKSEAKKRKKNRFSNEVPRRIKDRFRCQRA